MPALLIRTLLDLVGHREPRRAFCALMDGLFYRLTRNLGQVEVLMLTSNSFAAEQWRFSALEAANVVRVTEILHGIPSEELRGFFSRSIDSAASRKMLFVRPFSDLDLGAEYSRHPDHDSVAPINLKRNTATDSDKRAAIAYARKCAVAARARFCVALNGATHYASDYTTSAAFALEQQILRSIRSYARSHDIPIRLVYSVHPAHIKSGCATQLAALLDVDAFEYDSMPTWLYADLCVALYSSSMWDAQDLGCPTFISVRPSDGIFSTDLLLPGRFVPNGSSRLEALTQPMAAMYARGPLTEIDFAARAARLLQ